MITQVVSHEVLKEFCKAALTKKNVRTDVIAHVSESLIQTSLRGVDSHGIRLLPHYLRAIDSGRINPKPSYNFTKTSNSTVKLDADHTFGHAAGAEGMLKAISLANKNGMGSIVVYNSTHFGAAAYFSLLAANQNMIGISFTHADSLMLSYFGKRAYFGTNPICFAAPCEGEEPFCLDMATSRPSNLISSTTIEISTPSFSASYRAKLKWFSIAIKRPEFASILASHSSIS